MNILIIEDEDRMRKLLRDYFKKEKFSVFEGENGIEGIEVFKNNTIDIVILDIMLPYLDGWSVCKTIRKISKVPIIMLTAKGEEEDKLLGYELGVDDYITKPFSPKVLVAKVKALMKRSTINETKFTNHSIKYNGLYINELSNEVKIHENTIVLSPKEYDLLLYFIKNKDIVLSRDKILDRVWGFDYDGGLRTVDTHIKRLREKLGDKADYIVTVRGKGYKFEVNS